MEAYFDNAATTKVLPQVKDLMVKIMEEDFGNPSSLHMKGVDAEKYVRQGRETLARLWKVDKSEIIFTSGGTESNNMAIIGAARAHEKEGHRVITSAVEHASVANPFKYLEEQGFDVVRIGVDERGIVKLDELEAALNDDTILVSIMYVNNEVGAVMPVKDIADMVHDICPKAVFHVDAIQAFGKFRLYPKRMGIDLMSVSGHKIHGPKGSGALFVKRGTRIGPIILGGGQQQGYRSGTENVPAIAGMCLAAEIADKEMDERCAHMKALKDRLISGLTELEGVYSNSGEACHIASISFTGVRSEIMLHTLENSGIYVSSGSACSSNKTQNRNLSSTLHAMGLSPERLESTLRFSFAYDNTEEQVDYAIDVIKKELPVLRKYVRK